MKSSQYLNEVQKAIDYIESNIKNPITVKSVCEESLFSRWEFQRIFRALVGDSIGGYIRGRRLSLAVEELQSCDKKIIDIAISFQFSSQESFSRSFKEYFNYTPGKVRSDKLPVLSLIKPKINQERLLSISSNITHKPKIEDIPGKHLVGLKTEFESTLGSERKSFEKIYNHWKMFKGYQEKIDNAVRGFHYGLICAANNDFNQDQLEYLSCVEVRNADSIPSDATSVTTEDQKYAIFEVKGKPDSCHVIADFVYGIWLPKSGYRRGDGYDIEVFNHETYKLDHPDSIMNYCIPIQT